MENTNEPTKISVPCPDCGRKITIAVRTIDTLRTENDELAKQLRVVTDERNTYKARLSALEYMQKNPQSNFGDIFGDFLKGNRKY
jgi:FtsZ-binding cell division protein ZapB